MMNIMGRGMYGGDYNSMPDYMKQMTQGYYGGLRPFWGLTGLVDLVTSLLLIALLVALVRYVWSITK